MKKFLSLVLALVMTMSLVTISAGAKDFTDADKVTYTEAVDVLSAVKVIDGYTDGSFKPTTQLNRGQAAKILCNMILGPTTAAALKADTAPFKDVPADSTFAGYIAYCAQAGIIDGYTDGTFKPAAPLTGYAFMKLLLGALGYDKDVEGYNVPNWSINVAKRALSIGLDDGLVDDFDGTKIVTREEACLFALNTMTADMVEYDAKTSVSVGGAEVVIAGSKAKEVEYKDGKYDGNVYGKDKVQQFAEKYFTNLTVTEGRDSFERPANVWKLKAETIGTYSFVADLEYTEKVKVSEIYKDLGLSSSIDKSMVEVYEDGAEDDAATIRKNDEDTKFGGQGTLTEVFYNDIEDSVIITQVNTYIGKVNRTVAATKTQDTYIEVLTGDAASDHIEKNARANGTERFETEVEFEDDAYVLYTFSEKDDEIKAVALAESVTGVVTKVENDKEDDDKDHKVLTIDGTEYEASAKVAQELLSKVSPKNEYTIYLDSYGNTIFVAEEEYLSTDYALLWDFQDGTDWSKNRSLLVLADGTEKIVDTSKNYKSGVNDKIAAGTIVTFKQGDDGLYTLKPVKTTEKLGITVTPGANAPKGFTMGTITGFELNNNVAKITTGDAAANPDTATAVVNVRDTIYANSKTVFVVYNNTDDEWTAYTGVKNAPTVNDNLTGKVGAIWYCKGTSSIASIIYIVPDNDALVEDTNNNLLYVAGESVSNLIHDGDDYYTYNAVVNGKIETIKVADNAAIYLANGTTRKTYTDDDGNTVYTEAYKLNGLYSKFSVDSDGFITKAVEYTTNNGLTKFAGAGVGLSKNSADYTVRILDKDPTNPAVNPGTWTVDDDAKFFAVTTKGVITESTYGAITKDDNDKSYFIINNGMVTTMVVEEVANKDNAGAATVKVKGPASVKEGDTVTLTLDVTLADAKNDKIVGYQWYKNTVDAAGKIPGATGATLTLTNVTNTANNGTYYCEVYTVNEKVSGTSEATGVNTAANAYVLSVTMDGRTNVTVNGTGAADAVVLVDGSSTLTGVKVGSDVTISVQKSASASAEIAKVTVAGVELTAIGGVYYWSGKMPAGGLTVTVTKVVTPDPAVVTLTWNQTALVTINGETYTNGTATISLEEGKSYELGVAFSGSTLAQAKIVKENTTKLDAFGTDKYYFTANNGDELVIGLPTATLTLPANTTAKWTLAGVGTNVTAANGTEVPVDATVTLTGTALTNCYLKVTNGTGDHYVKTSGTFTMDQDVSITADKYWKVTLDNSTGNCSTFDLAQPTAAQFVKLNDTITVEINGGGDWGTIYYLTTDNANIVGTLADVTLSEMDHIISTVKVTSALSSADVTAHVIFAL